MDRRPRLQCLYPQTVNCRRISGAGCNEGYPVAGVQKMEIQRVLEKMSFVTGPKGKLSAGGSFFAIVGNFYCKNWEFYLQFRPIYFATKRHHLFLNDKMKKDMCEKSLGFEKREP